MCISETKYCLPVRQFRDAKLVFMKIWFFLCSLTNLFYTEYFVLSYFLDVFSTLSFPVEKYDFYSYK